MEQLNNETTFYLVRHGEAEHNVLGILSSWPEKRIFHLTEKGRTKVSETAEELSEKGIGKLYSSPITRTLETARIISERIGIGIVVDERLRETDFGVYDCGSFEARAMKYVTDLDRLDTDIAEIEGLRHVRERIVSFLTDIMKSDAGKRIVIVSHGDPIEVMRGVLLGQTLEESLLDFAPKKGSVTEVIVSSDILPV
jgi:broad specificity phosphatase PhoE